MHELWNGIIIQYSLRIHHTTPPEKKVSPGNLTLPHTPPPQYLHQASLIIL